MRIITTYSVKIKHFNHIFKETVTLYRAAVDFFIDVCMKEWELLIPFTSANAKMTMVEELTHRTKEHPLVKYDFDTLFYKMPVYLRRAAINDAIGLVSSHESNLSRWEETNPSSRGKKPSKPASGFTYPCLYRDNMYKLTGEYTAMVKVRIRNTWDWLNVSLRKSDMDYIRRHCSGRRMCAPTLRTRGREWFLDFPFEEEVTLPETDIRECTIASVDLGLNSPATVSIMRADGTVLGRHFLKLPSEYDCLNRAINCIKQAQQHGNRKMPRLWAKAKGVNDAIAVRTAQFIIDTAVMYNCDVIVMEHLDVGGKKRGSRKEKLHHWRCEYVQQIVTGKAHRLRMRVSRVCAWGTSRFAFDGSGSVMRGREAGFDCYSVCRFSNGKTYNCDLNASYNIGARYFVREITKSLPATARLTLEAKVPSAIRRSTCTLSTLISLNAVLAA